MEGIAFDQYQTFHCVGSDCPYTCCGGYWRIDVDEETDRFYQSCDGEFGEYLNKNIIRGGNGPAIMNLGANGRCAMLDTRGLCSIQIAYGSERLCQTCKLYPRIGWAQEGMNISYLTLSCPEVARALLARKTSLRILRHQLPDSLRSVAEPETDAALHAVRRQAFHAAIRILQDRECDIVQRQRLFLLMSQAVQEAVDAGDLRRAKKVLALFSRPEEYRAIVAGVYVRAEAADKVRFLRMLKGTVLTDMRGMAGFEFPVIFQRALDYMQDDTANLAGFVEYLKEIDSKQQQREFENLLVALLPGKYISEFAEHDLYRQAAYVLILAQLYRIFSALGHAGGTESENEIRGPLLVSYICRFFDHTSQEYKAKMAAALKEEHLTDMEFMLRLVG